MLRQNARILEMLANLMEMYLNEQGIGKPRDPLSLPDAARQLGTVADDLARLSETLRECKSADDLQKWLVTHTHRGSKPRKPRKRPPSAQPRSRRRNRTA